MIALSDDYPNNQVDFSPLVARARDQEADCIFLSEYRALPVINFCESLEAADWKPLLSTQTAVFSERIFRHGNKIVDGLLMSTYYIPDNGGEAAEEFSRVFRQTFAGQKPTHREVNSYDSLNLVIEAFDKVGRNREKLQQYFTSLGDDKSAYEGISGRFALAKDLGERVPYVVQLVDGRYVVVDQKK